MDIVLFMEQDTTGCSTFPNVIYFRWKFEVFLCVSVKLTVLPAKYVKGYFKKVKYSDKRILIY